MDEGNLLLPQHQRLIEESQIASDVAAARGYRSITTKADARRLGFADAQCNVPALLIPVWGVDGEIATYQLRPDTPRVKDGKPLKYETPAGSRMALDVPRGIRGLLGDPAVPLVITEGARKADSAVSHGLCCVALLGVWNWRGRNEHDGKVALPDWESVALNGRKVRIAFDSDVMEKRGVYAALFRLCGLFRQRGAHVEMIYLPAGPGGAKVGLDDFFAAGNSVGDLWQYATAHLREPADNSEASTGPYIVRENRIFYMRRVGDAAREPVELTNFSATILEEIIADDGASERGELVIAGTLADETPLPPIRVPLAQFAAMNWPTALWGTRAVVSAGMGAKDRTREAIQRLSPDAVRRREYAHSGWRRIEGRWAYLHADGAIGADGPVDGIFVRLGGPLAQLTLPELPTGDGLRDAVRTSLAVFAVAPDRVTVPLLGAAYRAPVNALRAADMAVHLAGQTGVMKSELAALAMQHYGAGFDRMHLPAQWASTSNALERLAFEAKDALLVIDDFAPQGSQQEINRLHATVDRVIRGAGNGAGRGRMYADGRLRPDFPPRGLIVSTGEDVPRGQSLRARLAIVEVGPGDVDRDALTVAQKHGATGRSAAAMAGYLSWLAGRLDDLRASAIDDLMRLRERASKLGSAHARTPDVVANLAYGWQQWLAFAADTGAITDDERASLWRRVWDALGQLAGEQAGHQRAEEPTRRFLDLVSTVIASGEAHIARTDGCEPPDAESWGWRMQEAYTGNGQRIHVARGNRIGWLDGDLIYLLPDAAYAAANRMATATGAPLGIAPKTLGKRLHERGLLAVVEPGGYTVPRNVDGKRQRVLAIPMHHLTPQTSGTSGRAHDAASRDEENVIPDEATSSGIASNDPASVPDCKPVARDGPVAAKVTTARNDTGIPDVPDHLAMPPMELQRAVIVLHDALTDGSLDRLPNPLPLPDDLGDYRDRARFEGLCRTYLDHCEYSMTARDGVVRLAGLIVPIIGGTAA